MKRQLTEANKTEEELKAYVKELETEIEKKNAEFEAERNKTS